MNIIFITGDHPRHKYLARKIASTGLLGMVMSEKRESHLPKPPEHLSADNKALFQAHFEKRESAEARFFGEEKWPDCEVLEINLEDLNAERVQSVLRATRVDLLLSYGCHMLDDATLNLVSGETWNIHGGLSPWYKGAITHFWPSYFLEPQMTGMTIHDLTQELDAGNVIHQNVAELHRGDGLHDLACRAVMKMGDELPTVIAKLNELGSVPKKKHATSGKLWRVADWRPEHLHLIYEVYGDKIVDRYLDGEFENKEPKLHRQF